MAHDTPIVFVVGVLGNIASFVCFLAPLSTFYRVCKKKTTEGFQSVPYVAALFCSMLWIFYAYIKKGEILIITINSFGCLIETIYLAIYITYCPKKARIFTLKLIFLFNLGGIFLIILLTHVLAKERESRLELLGWICVVLSTSVFAAPLSIIKVVIRTKSVEFMPFPLSLLLTISAIMWMTYGILLRDIYVTLPNIVGVTFGTIQMVLYAIYRTVEDQKLPEHKGDINDENVVSTMTNENQDVIPRLVDIVIGEEKKEEKQVQEPEKKQDQVANDRDQLTEHNNNNNNNKTREEGIQLQQQKEG